MLFSIASVSAQENTTDTVKVTHDNDNVKVNSDKDTNLSSVKSDDILTASDDSDNLGSSDSNDVLTATSGTFTELNTTIQKGGTINLDKDYTYDSGFITTGIVISNDGTIINGNGHTLNGNGAARIFNIAANNVLIKNIIFINGKINANGGAIYWTGNYGTVNNCNFTNNVVGTTINGNNGPQGGAIYWTGSNGLVINSTFNGNNASNDGGAIYWNSNYGTIIYSNFTFNNALGDDGGAVVFYGQAFGNLVIIPKHIDSRLKCCAAIIIDIAAIPPSTSTNFSFLSFLINNIMTGASHVTTFFTP